MLVHILNIESINPMKKFFGGNLGGGDGPPAPPIGATEFNTGRNRQPIMLGG